MRDGLLLVNKPKGMTSHDVVAFCRRLLGRRDVGHAGTLDPIATGLLIILIGKATKLSDFILNGDKLYETTLLLGCETDTDDISGEVLNRVHDLNLNYEQVSETVLGLTGFLNLPVPVYSAVKVAGSKLYQKARRGEIFQPPVREMNFSNIKLLDFNDEHVSIELSCAKGSYIRAWARAFGKKLGCGATVENLRRLRSEPYSLKSAVEMAVLEKDPSEKALISLGSFIPLNQSLPDFPPVKIDGLDEKLISNGQISRGLGRFLELEFGDRERGIKLLSRHSGRLLSVLCYQSPRGFKIQRVFPIND